MKEEEETQDATMIIAKFDEIFCTSGRWQNEQVTMPERQSGPIYATSDISDKTHPYTDRQIYKYAGHVYLDPDMRIL